MEGRSAIFKLLRGNGSGIVTIEVNPRARRVVQVRGRFNARPDAEAAEIVGRWVAAQGLEWNGQA